MFLPQPEDERTLVMLFSTKLFFLFIFFLSLYRTDNLVHSCCEVIMTRTRIQQKVLNTMLIYSFPFPCINLNSSARTTAGFISPLLYLH